MCHKPLKILFVDDQQECIEGYLAALEPGNYTCLATTNPGQALELYKTALAAEQEKFDVVVMDYRMPGMNGLELLTEIKKIDAHARIIFITAYGNQEIAQAISDYGVYACFSKPLEFQDLINIFDQIEREKGELKKAEADNNLKNNLQDNPRSLNILLVDDDPCYLEYCKRVLSRIYHNCTAINQPQAALQEYFTALQPGMLPFNVVITDLNMPGMSGIELIRQIRQYNSTAIVILMSATEDLAGRTFDFCKQVTHFLQKSTGLDDLISLLDNLTDRITNIK